MVLEQSHTSEFAKNGQIRPRYAETANSLLYKELACVLTTMLSTKERNWGKNAEVCGNRYFGLRKSLLYKELRDEFLGRV